MHRIIISSAETIGAFNTGFDRVGLHCHTERGEVGDLAEAEAEAGVEYELRAARAAGEPGVPGVPGVAGEVGVRLAARLRAAAAGEELEEGEQTWRDDGTDGNGVAGPSTFTAFCESARLTAGSLRTSTRTECHPDGSMNNFQVQPHTLCDVGEQTGVVWLTLTMRVP